jgi:hypothetical protein
LCSVDCLNFAHSGPAPYKRPERWGEVSASLKALYPQNQAMVTAVWTALLSKPQGERLDYFDADSEDLVRAGLEALVAGEAGLSQTAGW